MVHTIKCPQCGKEVVFMVFEKKALMGWISVKDRLPEAEYGESDEVLAISETGRQEILYFDGSNWCYPTGEVRARFTAITHWIPLPEPPKGE